MNYYFHVYDHNSCISKDIICILMKYYFNVLNHNSCISNGHYLHLNEMLFVFNHNSCISNGHYLHFN